MARRRAVREYRCKRCGEGFTGLVRLMHHRAAEHALGTMRDIRTMRDIGTMRDIRTMRDVPHSTGANC